MSASEDKLAKLKSAGEAAQEVSPHKQVDSAAVPCPLKNKHWIEIELVRENVAPVADEPYMIVTDQQEYRGKTNAQGIARVEGIGAGPCKICFTSLDGEAWEAL